MDGLIMHIIREVCWLCWELVKFANGTDRDIEYILPNDDAEQERLGMCSSFS
jgi:hypothetical protein